MIMKKQLMKKAILLIVGVLGLANAISGQLLLQDYYVAKQDGDRLQVRWEPTDPTQWRSLGRSGYTVALYDVSSVTPVLVESKKVSIQSKQAWEAARARVADDALDYFDGSIALVYPETASGQSIGDLFDVGDDVGRKDRLELGFLLYASTFDFEMVELSGLGTTFTVKPGANYQVKITADGVDLLATEIQQGTYQDFPSLTPTWGDKTVEIEVPHAEYQAYYLGYHVSRSTDGTKYRQRNTNIVSNTLGLSQDTSGIVTIQYQDSLANNETTYYYRLEGLDYFGERNVCNQVIIGSGYKPLAISPIIEYANQTTDNHADIRWYLPAEQKELVRKYALIWRPDRDTDYTVVVDSIDREASSYLYPMTHGSNYFRIQAYAERGKPVSSSEVMILGQDKEPPATPTGITALLDSAGIAIITWEPNEEEDLWGYRVYKSNKREEEFGLITASPFIETEYRDTIGLEFEMDSVYYILAAFDKRGNKSAFTDPIALERMDLFPPGSPVINSITQSQDTLVVSWAKSISPDAEVNQLYRRRVGIDEDWTLVQVVDSSTVFVGTYVDTDIDFDVKYAYTAIAFDDANLKSEPAPPKSLTAIKPKRVFDPFDSFSYEYVEDNAELTITWDFKEASRISKILVYRGPSSARMGKYKYLDPDATGFAEVTEGPMLYRICPIYRESTEQYLSEVIEIPAGED